MGFERLLDGVFFSCDVGWAKPHARYFEAIERRLGRSGHELLFFDDAPENVEAARATGWVAEQVDTAESLREHLARHTGLDIAASSAGG
jgi:putative hydrolase of the HAD superfamily